MAVTQAQVAQLYVALFNRAPEGAGFNAWLKAGATKTQAQLANDMLNSPAVLTYFPADININNSLDFVNIVYKNILGKDKTTDLAGVKAWAGEIDKGVSRGDVLVRIFETAKSAAAIAADPTAAKIFANKTEIAEYMATKIASIATNDNGLFDYTPFQTIIAQTTDSNLAEQKSKIDALASTKFHTLTTDTDTIVGNTNADIIKGVVSSFNTENTLNHTDKIDGGSGDDELNLTLNTNFNGFSTGEMKNVEHLKITNSSSYLKEFNASKVTDLKSISMTGSNAVRVINLANIVDLSVADLKNDYISIAYNSSLVSGNADEQKLTLSNVGAATETGMLSNSITAAFNGIEKLSITSKKAPNYIKGVNVKEISVDGDANLDIQTTSNLEKLDASKLTGAITADLLNTLKIKEIKGGSADDIFKIKLDNTSVPVTIDGGDGDDVVELGSLNLAVGLNKLTATKVETLTFTKATITGNVATIDMAKAQDVKTLNIGLEDGMFSKTVDVINSKIETLNYVANPHETNKIIIDSEKLTTINFKNEKDTTARLAGVTATNAKELSVNIDGKFHDGGNRVDLIAQEAATININNKAVIGNKSQFNLKSAKVATLNIEHDAVAKNSNMLDIYGTGNTAPVLETINANFSGSLMIKDISPKISTINFNGRGEYATGEVTGGSLTASQDINVNVNNLKPTSGINSEVFRGSFDTLGTVNMTFNNSLGGVTIQNNVAGSLNFQNNSGSNLSTLTFKAKDTNLALVVTDVLNIEAGEAHNVVFSDKVKADKMNINLAQTLGELQFIAGANLTANDITLKLSQISGVQGGNIDLVAKGNKDFKLDFTGSVKDDKLTFKIQDTANTIQNFKASGDMGAGVDTYSLDLSGATDNSVETIRTIDLSGLTNVESGTLKLNDANINLISAKTTDGKDEVTLVDNLLSGAGVSSVNNFTLSLGAGDDVVTTGTLVANKTLTIDGGEGADTFNINASFTDANASKFITLTNVTSGDKIQFANLSSYERVEDNPAIQNAATLKDAVNEVIKNNTDAAITNKAFYFTYKNDTYIVKDGIGAASNQLTNDDHLIKIAGVRADDLIITMDNNALIIN